MVRADINIEKGGGIININKGLQVIMNLQTVVTLIVIIISISALPSNAGTKLESELKAGNHGPIGVMGDHTHEIGELMLSYHYMFTAMEGMRNGTDGITDEQVLADFMATPTKMNGQMHMFGGMFGLTDKLTLMGSIPYVKKSMYIKNRAGGYFKTDSEGLGDIKFDSLYAIVNQGKKNVILNLGMSFPTGSIDKKDTIPTPTGPSRTQLPYPMQLGSGTWDITPGVTFNQRWENLNLGGQVKATIRLNENDRNYKLGNRLNLTMWSAHNFNYWMSSSFRLNWKFWQKIDGADETLNQMLAPTARPDFQGGNRLDGLIGINFINRSNPKFLKGQRISLELGSPFYQDFNGSQLETDWILLIGWQSQSIPTI